MHELFQGNIGVDNPQATLCVNANFEKFRGRLC